MRCSSAWDVLLWHTALPLAVVLACGTAQQLITNGTVQGGMIPKLETCIAAVRQGAEAAVILDGRAPHAVLVELFTEHGIGTLITRD